MYCPVDGTEWREGITRCPEHDVDLVDEPLEVAPRPSAFDRARSEGVAGVAAIAVALAGVVYAVTGVVFHAWATLAQKRNWLPTTEIEAVQFLQSAARAVAVGALACLGAAVLGRAYLRLARAPEPEVPEEGEDEDLPAPSGAWFVPLLATFVVCFAAVWAAISLWIAWETATTTGSFDGGFTPVNEEEDLLTDLFAYQGAAFACFAGSLAALGALLMARAHDRLSGAA